MKRAKWILLLAIGALIAWGAWRQFGLDSWLGGSPTGKGDLEKSRRVRAMGRVEPAGGVIEVGAPVGDRLQSLAVGELQEVKAGQSLGELASLKQRELELTSLQSQLAEAEARYQAELQAADARISVAKLQISKVELQRKGLDVDRQQAELLKKQHTQAENELTRLQGLDEALIAPQEKERQALLVEKAKADVAAADSALEVAQKQAELAAAAADADVRSAEAAKAQVLAAIPRESLKRSIELAELQKKASQLSAPCAGSVLKIYSRPGEWIAARPVMRLADLSKMHIVAEVYEADAKRIKEGQTAKISSRAFASPHDQEGLSGKVVRIGRLISTPEMRSLDPFAPSDVHTVQVRIELDAKSAPVASRLVNLQVDVEFQE